MFPQLRTVTSRGILGGTSDILRGKGCAAHPGAGWEWQDQHMEMVPVLGKIRAAQPEVS